MPVLGLLGLVLVGLESASEWMLQPGAGTGIGITNKVIHPPTD